MGAFQERLWTELNGGLSILSLQLGHSLGFFESLAAAGWVTPAAFADRTGYSERYIREWLEAMVAGGYLDYRAKSVEFSLSREYAEVLTNPDSPWSAMGVFGWLSSFGRLMPQLEEAYHNGGGVSYDDYGEDMAAAQALTTRPMFVNDYVSTWIPIMPDVEARLRNGGRVADVGCGEGWSAIALARDLPTVEIDAIDPDQLSIEKAQLNAREAGVADRIRFHQTTVEAAPIAAPYDLVTAFECLHDMPYPVEALTRMRDLAALDGTVLIADEAVCETLEENIGFMGSFFYNFSVLHCLPQAMVFPGAEATGTVFKPSLVREYARAAGFSAVDVLEIEHPQFRFYRLTP
jgi:2-polyprenyl-3-methyl-5-hydroxy-6-metoxy-1,4-benzoquinol methylase